MVSAHLPRLLATVVLVATLAFSPGCGGTVESENRLTGAECEWGLQCEGELCLGAELAGEATGWAGGMCSKLCADGNCPESQHCTDLMDGRYCLPACTDIADCREGYVCHSQLKVCYPDCHGGFECGEGYVCGQSGECEFDWPVLAPIGSPCDQAADCMHGWCLAEKDEEGVDTGWSGGACTVPCGPPPELCPPGAGCMIMDEKGYCLPICVGPPHSPECREDYICDPDVHLCLPDCNLGFPCGPQLDCKPSGVCMPVGGRRPPPGR